jgi:hypothetical protein
MLKTRKSALHFLVKNSEILNFYFQDLIIKNKFFHKIVFVYNKIKK